MRFIADLHVHSHYSRATSKDMCPEGIWKWAQLKGIRVIGTGDFTHPGWLKELDEKFARGVLGLAESILKPGGPLDVLRMKLSREPSIRGRK